MTSYIFEKPQEFSPKTEKPHSEKTETAMTNNDAVISVI